MSSLAQFVWNFEHETEVPSSINDFLIKGEEFIVAYKTSRGNAVFSNKRLILQDSFGKMGTKTETYSIPYKTVNMFAIEEANLIDVKYRVEMWTNVGLIKINIKRGMYIDKISDLLAEFVL